MGSYVPSTGTQREEMLRAVGVSSTRDLFRDVPEQMLLTEPLDGSVRHREEPPLSSKDGQFCRMLL